jgi:predicted RNA-binding Zn-ribbon protein involved in translation (DUF1610 family)
LDLGFKPKHIELKGPETLQLIWPLFEAIVFACGNCDKLIVPRNGSKRPIRCSKCGGDIDWSDDISRKKFLFYPQCGRAEFRLDDDHYCDSLRQLRL